MIDYFCNVDVRVATSSAEVQLKHCRNHERTEIQWRGKKLSLYLSKQLHFRERKKLREPKANHIQNWSTYFRTRRYHFQNSKQLKMDLLRKHWYDLGAFFFVVVSIYVFINYNFFTEYQTLMWLSLASLFLHQLEEYRIAGTFPGMINSVLYNSKLPDRYPLNANTAFYVNVVVGWTFYFLAAILGEKTIWLGIATMLVSVGNIIAHTIIFNIKGKTIYNAGLATSWLLFVPCVYFFILVILNSHPPTKWDYCIGVALGITLNFVGILKLIDWMADVNTTYIFNDRNLLPKDRK